MSQTVEGKTERPGEVIVLGSRVTMRDETSGRQDTFTLVSPFDAKVSAGKLSSESPLAHALVGAQVSHTVTVHTPRGDRRVTVLALA
ncbi:MAG: GreA/GreB family elongation factor [Thermoleophilaceae bacterium]